MHDDENDQEKKTCLHDDFGSDRVSGNGTAARSFIRVLAVADHEVMKIQIEPERWNIKHFL